MSDNNVTENFEADAADIAAAAAATEEFTNTIGEIMVTETEIEADLPTYHEGPIQTVGRRKRAIVRVRMVEYFPNKLHQQLIKAPLVLIDRDGQFDIHANLTGGGPTGQAGAFRLAIARALNIYNPADCPALKKAGFLTRDARAVERKKAGLHKARRAPQYSKR